MSYVMLFRFREVDVCFGAFVFRSGPGLFGMAGWGRNGMEGQMNVLCFSYQMV
jgi:hypothetical protein